MGSIIDLVPRKAHTEQKKNILKVFEGLSCCVIYHAGWKIIFFTRGGGFVLVGE